MHLSIVHKEIVEIKEESMTLKDEPNLDTEKVLLMCDMCDSKFETQITLNKHIDSQHVENKTFKCEICNHSCTKMATLKKHIRDAPRGGAGGAAAPPDFGRSEGAARQRRCAALLPAPLDF